MEAFLVLLSNFSSNPGCETFSLVFDEGYESNVSIAGALDLDIGTIDLLPVTISPMNETDF